MTKHSDPREAVQKIIDAGQGRTSMAREPVNEPMIHHLCDALDDTNPIYLDRTSAQDGGHPDVVAPPAALQVWNMVNPGEQHGTNAVDEAYLALKEGGYPNVVAVNCEQTYERYLVPGDVLTSEEKVEQISSRKRTGLGYGYFITTLATCRDQRGEVVGTTRFRTLWYANADTEDKP